jgi:hypothetical protein
MSHLLSALPPRLVEGAEFSAAIVFAVAALALLQARLEHGRAPRPAYLAVLGLAFAAMLIGGAVGLATMGLAFVPLGLFLCGAASCAILAEMLWRFHRGGDGEMRRVLAQDL